MLLNALPARTWNRLHVNDSPAEIPESPAEPLLTVQAPPQLQVSGEGLKLTLPSAMGAPYAQLMADAQALTVTAAGQDAAPAVLHLTRKEGENTAALRLFLEAKEGAVLNVILTVGSAEWAEGHCAVRTQVRAGAGARVTLYVANLLGPGVDYTDDVSCTAGERAVFSLQRLDLGGNSVHTACCAELSGKRSRFESGIAYQVQPGHLLDMNWLARHLGRKTESAIQVNGVLQQDAQKCFRGTIDFVKGCAGAKGAETESVLLMGDRQVNQTVPLILCDEEDVDGSHGASIGRLDERTLFYLASRGLSEDAARRLIAQSRIDLMRDQFPDEGVRGEIDRFTGKEDAQ